jgi:hypothetical protein
MGGQVTNYSCEEPIEYEQPEKEGIQMTDFESEENAERRDDVLENNVQVTGREFQRGSDGYAEDRDLRRRYAERSFAQESEMFDRRVQQLDKLNDLEARRRERSEVSTDDRDGLRFRDAAIHSTAVGSLEGEIATVGAALEEAVEDDEVAD